MSVGRGKRGGEGGRRRERFLKTEYVRKNVKV